MGGVEGSIGGRVKPKFDGILKNEGGGRRGCINNFSDNIKLDWANRDKKVEQIVFLIKDTLVSQVLYLIKE